MSMSKPKLRSALVPLLTGALGLTLLHVATPRTVSACSRLPCRGGAVLPSAGVVPANAVEFVWRAPRSFSGPDGGTSPSPRLFQLVGSARSELETTSETRAGLVHVRPKLPVAADAQLLFTFEETCHAQGEVASGPVRVGAAATLPTTLGALSAEIASGPVMVDVTSGECSAPVEGVYADLTVDLTEQARPFADVLRYQLKVDGAAVGSYGFRTSSSGMERLGTSGLGAAKDRVYVLCGLHRGVRLMSGLSEGVHRVQLVGLLPDDSEVASNELQVELRCPAGLADGGLADAGGRGDPDAGDAQVSSLDGASPTGNPAAASEAGALVDAGSAGGQHDGAVVVVRDDGDDGCSLGGSRGSSGGLWTLALALGALVRRRRPR